MHFIYIITLLVWIDMLEMYIRWLSFTHARAQENTASNLSIKKGKIAEDITAMSYMRLWFKQWDTATSIIK